MDVIPYTKHHITLEDEAAVLRVLRSKYLTCGPEVELFEAELAEKCGAKYAVAVNSGTAALHLAYLACGIGPGSVVAMPCGSFVATANAALYCGARIIFVDDAPGPNTTTLPACDWFVDVTLGGSGIIDCGPEVIVDACHGPLALPPVAAAAVFSFHPAKHVAAGEGGAIVTNDYSLYLTAKSLREHGRGPNPGAFAFVAPPMHQLGYNYRMDEMSAALARSQLTRYDWSVQQRREIAARYDTAFAGKVRTVPHGPDSARHLYQLLVENRDTVRQELLKRGVGTQVHYSPIIPLQPYYRERFGYRPGMFPNAEWHAAHTLSIPMFPTLAEQEIEHVIHSVLEVCG